MYVIFYQLTKFKCHNFFPSQDIKQNMTTMTKKRGKQKHKFEYLENEKSFIDGFFTII